MKQILAYLAFDMKQRFGEGLINAVEAQKIVQDILKDEENGFGYELSESRRYSKQIIELSKISLELIVSLSPDEIGFFHRAFQEYLAACHLSRLSKDEQLTIIGKHCNDPQWREVLLGLFHLTRRSEDIKQFVECIQEKYQSANTIERLSIELLLCETAFGDFNCPVGLAKELTKKTFDEVEVGSWMPHRECLLQNVLNGLRTTRVKELVKPKLQSWFPCRAGWQREYVFRAMATWPKIPEVIDCLWKGMHDEDPASQREAARALAALAGGDENICQRIAYVARNALDPKIRAASIEALMHGWPNHKNLRQIIDAERRSISPELRLISIFGKIQINVQTEADREELIFLGSPKSGIDYNWRDDVSRAIMQGWPKSSKAKNACFDALQAEDDSGDYLAREIALRILLEGYPHDEDVAQFFANEIREKEYPFVLLHTEAWRLLSKNFKDQPEIVEVTDEWIAKSRAMDNKLAEAALVGRTPIAKALLISLLSTSSVPHWAAEAIIEGWGMEDAEVAEGLSQLAFGSNEKASQIGYLLPQIIKEKTKCRKRLMELLQDPDCARLDFVLHGLVELGNSHFDDAIVDTALKNLPSREHWGYKATIAPLIMGYSSDTRIKEFAKKEIASRDGYYAIVAQAYGNDEAIRRSIINIACPLPVNLRKIIAQYLGDGEGEESFVMSLLELYDHEINAEVRTQASISYHNRMLASRQDPAEALQTLSQNIVCYGFDNEERRQAAFCGLTVLGRLDVMINAKEQIGGDRICKISLRTKEYGYNMPLLQCILKNWDYIKCSFGSEFWQRFSLWESSQWDLWEALCLFADEYPSVAMDAIRFFEENQKRNITPHILRLLAKTRPKGRLLLDYCLKALGSGFHNYPSLKNTLVAAELLGTHFGGDDEVLACILSGLNRRIYSHGQLILALCEGWPERDELEHFHKMDREHKLRLSPITRFYLDCCKSPAPEIFNALKKRLLKIQSDLRWSTAPLSRPILRRLKGDDKLYEMLNDHLAQNPTPSEKATFPNLMRAARGVSAELRAWCLEELDRQLDSAKTPEIGIDLIAGGIRPVAHSLLEVLSRPTYVEL